MPTIKSLDTFIEQTNHLLTARPSTTRITCTYSHRSSKTAASKQTPSETVDSAAPNAILYVKTYDPLSGTCYRIKISKTNQLSRIWAAIGTRGVDITRRQNAKTDSSGQDGMDVDGTEQEKKAITTHVKGAAAVMTGTEIVYDSEPEPVVASAEKPAKAGKKKNKKR